MIAPAPLIVRQFFDALSPLNRTDGLTGFLVEQNAYHALKLAHRGYVMVNGVITMSGSGRELLARDDLHGVLIASPEHWHAKMASDAILATVAVSTDMAFLQFPDV